MRFCSRLGLLGLALILGASLGCRQTPPAASKVDPEKKGAQQEDVLQNARDTLAQAREPNQFREALLLFADHMQSPEVRRDLQKANDEQREFCQKTVFLSLDEMEEVEAGSFRPLDAHHLESCFLLRDVARRLEKTRLPPLELAQLALAWVCRQVLLDPPVGHSWVPSHLVLRSGFGTSSDRALLYLALLRQMQMEGCVLGLRHSLVGVRLSGNKQDNLYLFDLVLGQPVPGPEGKGVATLAQVRQKVELLQPLGIPAKDFAKAEIYLNCPLTSLAPRMKILEESLPEHDRIVLYVDGPKLAQAMGKLAEAPIRVGNRPPGGSAKGVLANSATRSMRLFYPPEEGGVDQTGRLLAFRRSQLPLPQLVGNFHKMRLLNSRDLHPEAGFYLLNQALDIQTKFVQQPREMLMRGQSAAMQKRLDRIRTVLEDIEFGQADEGQFHNQVREWRDQANLAFLAKNRKDPSGPARIQELLNADQFLPALLQVDAEMDTRKYEKKTLTYIVLTATKDNLGQNGYFLMAADLQEKAERLQAILEYLQATGKAQQTLQNQAADAWLNSGSYWSKYVERYTLGPAVIKTRLNLVRESWERRDAEAASLHLVLRDWSQSCFARLNLAHALEHEGQPEAARKVLDSLARDLADLPRAVDLSDSFLDPIRGTQKDFFTRQQQLVQEFQPNSNFLQALQSLVQLHRQQLKG